MRYNIGRGGVDRPVRNVCSSFKPQTGVNKGDYLVAGGGAYSLARRRVIGAERRDLEGREERATARGSRPRITVGAGGQMGAYEPSLLPQPVRRGGGAPRMAHPPEFEPRLLGSRASDRNSE